MSVLSWGKNLIQHTASVDGAPAANAEWVDLPTPKEDTTKLTPEAGKEVVATEEGGDVVDSRRGKNSYTFEFEVFVKKGEKRPFDDDDGVITGEHALRNIPEDDECEGILIDRCTLSAEQSYSTADGIIMKYSAKVLKPKTGKMVKPYTKTAGA